MGTAKDSSQTALSVSAHFRFPILEPLCDFFCSVVDLIANFISSKAGKNQLYRLWLINKVQVSEEKVIVDHMFLSDNGIKDFITYNRHGDSSMKRQFAEFRCILPAL